ncbi:DUF3106 domain-containing protein [Paraburkholderia sp. DHOC27]|uniref:DUF3106 domain-containing protein n=1 Tax=Paraburkholderia sp. DHOC27 TaxID=2303330 RepID=UPI000E3BB508|nr:DUF3106 domain-containing protein [Paraburkholderia sp. DHOC27]RFU43818.1 DUF3106 domain-containing protein [Paraburkholderia sp. DHOC27]
MSYKRGLAVVSGCAIAALVSFAATYPRFYPNPVSAPAVNAGPGTPAKLAAPVAGTDVPGTPVSPLSWARLTDAQRVALAPFAAQWDTFSDERKRRWIKIASRYSKMTLEQQKGLHERMTEWVHLTPDQRRVARENYQVSKELPREARQKAWKAYQQLPEEQKERLAATERKRRPTVVSAPPSGKTELKDINRLVNARDHGASGVVAAAETASTPGAAMPVAPAVPSAASVVPATPIPVSPHDAPSLYKGS